MDINKDKMRILLEKIQSDYVVKEILDISRLKNMLLVTQFFVITQFRNTSLIVDGCKAIIENDEKIEIKANKGHIEIYKDHIYEVTSNACGIFRITSGNTTVYFVSEKIIEKNEQISSFWQTPYFDKTILKSIKQKSNIKESMVAGNKKVRIYRLKEK